MTIPHFSVSDCKCVFPFTVYILQKHRGMQWSGVLRNVQRSSHSWLSGVRLSFSIGSREWFPNKILPTSHCLKILHYDQKWNHVPTGCLACGSFQRNWLITRDKFLVVFHAVYIDVCNFCVYVYIYMCVCVCELRSNDMGIEYIDDDFCYP